MSQESNPVGRPLEYSQEIALKICSEFSTSSKSLKTICAPDDMPSVRTVLGWLAEGDKENGRTEFKEFLHSYTRAKQEQADFLTEEMLEIADDSSQDLARIDDYGNKIEDKEFTNRSRLRVDTRKWIASKLKPKKYGDKIDLNHGGSLEIKQITGMEVK